MRHTPRTPPGTLHRIPGGAYIITIPRTRRVQEFCVADACDPPLYEEVRLPSLAASIFVIEARGTLLVDAVSLATALKMNVQVAVMGLLLDSRRTLNGVREGLDHRGADTVLLPVESIKKWLLWPHRARIGMSTEQFVQVWDYEWPRALETVRERLRKADLSRVMRKRAALAVQARRARSAEKALAAKAASPKPRQGGRPRPGSVPPPNAHPEPPAAPPPSPERPADLPEWMEWCDGAPVITHRLIRALWICREQDGPLFKRFHLSADQLDAVLFTGFHWASPLLQGTWNQTFGSPEGRDASRRGFEKVSGDAGNGVAPSGSRQTIDA
jgi:hypothetical protein